jgi:hypothetical protein
VDQAYFQHPVVFLEVAEIVHGLQQRSAVYRSCPMFRRCLNYANEVWLTELAQVPTSGALENLSSPRKHESNEGQTR